MREEKASSSEGSVLVCRVFVSKIESSCITVGIGEGERLALALDGDGKKSVTWDCDGDTYRLLDLFEVSGMDVGAHSPGRFGSALDPGIVLSNISSCSAECSHFITRSNSDIQ
jgi:hypothetical protein